ncbi:MAG: sugar phosphate isomerase/epimerase [Phycisphaerae bacterium]|nr:sugar phosphate isomerase/epimerase [Phycisphaerae bacterium]
MTASSTRRGFLGGGAALAAGTFLAPSAGARAESTRSGYRLRLSMAAYSYRNVLGGGADKATMTIEQFIDLCADLRLDATELTSYYIYKAGPAYMHELKARAFRKGVAVSGTSVGNNFCLPLGTALDKQLADLRQWVDNAVEMGAPHIRVFAGKAGGQREEDYKRMIAAMKQAVEYAGSRGVFLGIENHGYLTETAADVLRIVKDVPSPWFGVNLDTGNFKDDGYAQIAALVPKAINVQVKTLVSEGGQRRPADVPRIFSVLREAGYHGYVALEYEDKEDPKTGVPKFLEKMHAAAVG